MDILLTTAYLPPIPYMAAALRSERLLIEATETYAKRTHRNHAYILGPNGINQLSVPVTRINGSRTKSRDIRISDHEPWQRTHWRSICTAYSNAPFFLYYSDALQPFYERSFGWLLELNNGILETLSSLLQKPVKVSETRQYEKSPMHAEDLRSVDWDAPEAMRGRGVPYVQTFSDRMPFIPGLSIIDLLFNLGPEAGAYLAREAPPSGCGTPD